MKKILILAGFLPLLFAFGSDHSKLEATTKVTGDELVLKFKISANDGMTLTHQAPWSLTLSNFTDINLTPENGKFVSREYDQALPGFTVKTKVSGPKGSIDFQMRAFVCTEDKTLCYPQSHKGTVTWSKT